MAYTATLELIASPDNKTQAQILPELPDGLSIRIEKANLVLNHGLLVGELLGIPIHQAQRIIDQVYDQADTYPYFDVEKQTWLLNTYTIISKALDSAINEDGTPADNASGKALTQSDLLDIDNNDSLIIKHRRVRLEDLRHKLSELTRFLSFAIGNNLWIKMY